MYFNSATNKDVSTLIRTHLSWGEGTKNLDEIKKNLTGLDYSHFVVEAYNVKVPSGWMVLIPLEHGRVCLYSYNHFILYLESFTFGTRLSFTPFVKDIFKHFWVALSQITPNS